VVLSGVLGTSDFEYEYEYEYEYEVRVGVVLSGGLGTPAFE
jgi:hypothetical protein